MQKFSERVGARNHFFWPSLRDRQQLFGEKVDLVSRRQLSKQLYKCMATRVDWIWDPFSNSTGNGINSGSIYNVEYNTNGSLLLAATENKNVLILSANTHRLEGVITNAHDSCVNSVKFLDWRTFVTCSDDCTLAVWDIRNWKNKLKSLIGHKNWVKSIEYDSSKGILLSAAYDQTVLKWDINSASDNPQNILQINNMLRMVLSPDKTKMFISTADGYILIIHDLDLNKLSEDLRDFVPDLYRLMQDDRNYGIDLGTWFNPLFTSGRNRVELISDFPQNDKNGYITSLDVHPFGWALLSRNTAGDMLSEWTCLHDIRPSNESLEMKIVKRMQKPNYFYDKQYLTEFSEPSVSGNTINDTSVENPVIVVSNQIGSTQPHTTVLRKSRHSPENKSDRYVYKNISRLKYYIPERNDSHGFIKELCFSPDGRIICSPYQSGYRLLSFDENCSEISECMTTELKELHQLKSVLSHPDSVLTTKFSPTYCQIASGCLMGRVIFSQPIL